MSVENNNPAGEAGELAEIDWLAFAYVAGELDGRELEEWTSRLADGDVEACEAVAAAVELVLSMSNFPSVATDAGGGVVFKMRDGAGNLHRVSVAGGEGWAAAEWSLEYLLAHPGVALDHPVTTTVSVG